MAYTLKDLKSEHLKYNSLAGLLWTQRGKYTIIDFKDESSLRGKIIDVDGYMNLEAEDCIYLTSRGDIYPFENFFVKGRNIRYVHLSKNADAIDIIEGAFKQNNIQKPIKTKRTFKQSRAHRYQSELLQEITAKHH